jgi:hypothetical protein
MLTSLHILPGGNAVGVLTTVEPRQDLTVDIPAAAMQAWLDTSGDGVTSYRDDLTAMVAALKG